MYRAPEIRREHSLVWTIIAIASEDASLSLDNYNTSIMLLCIGSMEYSSNVQFLELVHGSISKTSRFYVGIIGSGFACVSTLF